ncbi:MAG: alpha/beta fold hydrolase [Pseudomonadales bacterium]|jgi:pimeloyl-ACP methyl ester carboxylesterase|nr:alpha/beta fold hydrolase [Pseudomonadales bacterium]
MRAFRILRPFVLLACSVDLPTAAAAAGLADAGPALVLAPCHVTDASAVRGVDAECGTLRVPLDYDDPDAAQLELSVVRVPALAAEPAPSALTVIQGGPGGSSIDLYLSIAGALGGVLRERDILLVDQRGTGRSAPLRCPEDSTMDLDASLDPATVREAARRCLDALDTDPRQFTTSVAVRDLERVRAALGYDQLDLYGASYGTRVALHYLHRHPERTRSIVIDGVAPVGWVLGPTIAADAQRSLEALFERCRNEPACAARFGDPAVTFSRLLDRVAAAAEEVELRHPVSGETTSLRFGREQLTMAVRMLSYQPETAALLPLLIAQADAGDPAPLAAQAMLIMANLGEALATGMHNSVVCSEDLPFVDAPPDASDTYLGNAQLAVLQAMCEVWPQGVVDADLREPFVSDVPALVLSGSEDPVTPPENGRVAAQQLTRSLEIVGTGQGHGLVMRGCLPRVLADFVASAEPETVEADCVEDLAAAPIFTSFAGAAP